MKANRKIIAGILATLVVVNTLVLSNKDILNQDEDSADFDISEYVDEAEEEAEASLDLVSDGSFTVTDGYLGGKPSAATKKAPDGMTLEDAIYKCFYAVVDGTDEQFYWDDDGVTMIADLRDYQITPEELESTFQRLYNLDARLFFVNAAPKYTFSTSTGLIKKLKITYLYDAPTISSMLATFDNEVDNILSVVDDGMNDTEKCLLIHDYFCQNYGYDTRIYSDVDNTVFSAYGLFTQKKGVCQAYASAYLYILNKIGVKSSFVSSENMCHVWNLVQIDGQYYHVDVTWDDPTPDLVGRVNHYNFLRSDAAMQSEECGSHHSWSAEAPADSRFDSSWWVDITSAIFRDGDLWYCSDDKGQICSYNIKESTKNVVSADTFTIPKDRWWYWGGGENETDPYWLGNYSTTVINNGIMYYNLAESVWCVNLDGSNNQKIADIPKEQYNGYVYGLQIKDNTLYCIIKQEYTDSNDNIYPVIDLSSVPQSAPKENQSEPAPEVNSGAVVASDTIQNIKDNGGSISVEAADGFTWTIEGENVTENIGQDIDLNIECAEDAVPAENTERYKKNASYTPFEISHDGEFGFTAGLDIDYSSDPNAKSGDVVSLIYYEPESDTMQYQGSSTLDENLTAHFDFTHASSYVAVLDTKIVGLPGDADEDGKVNIRDLIKLKKYLLGSEETIANCDMNYDGKTKSTDFIISKQNSIA